ncbi:MAG: MFS transporter, partial [Chloroflexi bacterium]|nr:MFS transporter [Chloroflexota bacterium]
MITGSVLMAVGNGLLPLADSIPGGWQSGWLLATNIVAALGLALYVTNTNPFLMSVTGTAERNHVFSVQAALGPLAGFAGSLFGGILPGLYATLAHVSLDQPGPYRYPLLIAAAMLIFSVLALRAARDVRDTPTNTKVVASTTGAAPVGLIVLLALVILLQVAGEGVARTFFNVYLDAGLSVPTAQIGALAALGQLLAVPAALFAPVIMVRWRHARTYIVSTLGMALSLLPLALIPHWSAAGFGFMGTMMVAATARTVINIFGMEIVAPAWRTVIAGATSMAVGLSWAIMGLGGGYIITALGYPFLFGTGALLTAAGALVFWAYFRV